jgi:hypothetical protein
MNRDNCDQKTQLLKTYQDAAEVYSKTVAELARGIGKLNRIEHDRLSVAAERARLTAQEARNNVDAHTIEHGC